jgi:DHA1 family bicyclomycin/chloramphenicol resistance-like MFS transporter
VLGAGQFGLGAAIAPLVGALGNDAFALAVAMTAGMVIAFIALVAVGVPAAERMDTAEGGVIGDAVPEPA